MIDPLISLTRRALGFKCLFENKTTNAFVLVKYLVTIDLISKHSNLTIRIKRFYLLIIHSTCSNLEDTEFAGISFSRFL